MIFEKTSLIVIGSLASNSTFLKEAFGFFDEVYASIEIPSEEMAMLFLAKKPQITLISIDVTVSTRYFSYLERVKASDQKHIIAILFFSDTSALTMQNFLKYEYDFYRIIDRSYLLENQFNACLESLKSLYLQRRETYVMKRYYQYLIDNSIVSQTDPKGKIVFANDAFYKVTGFSKTEVIGNTHKFMRHPVNDTALYASMWQTISNGGVWRDRILNKNKDGTDFWADTLIIPFVDETGSIVQYTSIRRDITHVLEEQRETEKKALLAQYQLEVATTKETFLSLFTHELKTPLNAIINFSHYLYDAKNNQRTIDTSREIYMLQEIHKSGFSMLHHVNTLLDLQKLRSKKIQYSLSVFNIKHVMENIIEDHKLLVHEHNRIIEYFLASGDVYSDEYRFSQIVSNILSNAIKYGDKKILITLRMTDEEMTLSIEDDGKGIQDKKNVFGMFEQDGANITLMQQKGTGIGLYFVKLLCEDLEFNYSIEDSVSLGGTHFRINKLLRKRYAKSTGC